jgi:hypothetical protein
MTTSRLLGLVVLSGLVFASTAWASHNQSTCSNRSTLTTTVSDADGHTTTYDSQGAGGAPEGFDPVPLLSTTVTVSGRTPSCLVAHLSVHSLTAFGIGDKYAVYQVLVDGVPMIGHSTWCSTSTGINFACVVMDNNTDGSTDITAHSYHFYAVVTPGTHRVEVFYAGCCSGLGAYSGGLLTLHHR